MLWSLHLFLLLIFNTYARVSEEHTEPELYYYGLEESERALARCGVRQACAALLRRYWRPPALLRLCRCARRQRCDARAPPRATLPLNNHADFQFCQPVTDWPECSVDDTSLTVVASNVRLNPDELEELHHRNIQLVPPKVTFNCRCREPNYWKLNTTIENENIKIYQCASLPPCKSREFCGNVDYHLFQLYQSCLCPKHHMCVHSGGNTKTYINELLYSGKGWKAYCQPINNDYYSYEDY